MDNFRIDYGAIFYMVKSLGDRFFCDGAVIFPKIFDIENFIRVWEPDRIISKRIIRIGSDDERKCYLSYQRERLYGRRFGWMINAAPLKWDAEQILKTRLIDVPGLWINHPENDDIKIDWNTGVTQAVTVGTECAEKGHLVVQRVIPGLQGDVTETSCQRCGVILV